ncbi:MAG: hypothetical protein GX234_02580 [Clostridiales bacterium]|nr:hypothetical protein [Clostridiales bacterium]
MGRVLLCVGKRTEKPYYMEKICRQAYSAEELCFLIRQNAYLLDEGIVDRKLTDWLSEECGLEELGRKLHGFIRSGCSVASFVATLLAEVAYCTPEEIQAVEQLLKNNAGLSGSEKKKLHADYLVQNGKYAAALREYDMLLEQMEEGEPLQGKIWHNIGVAYAGMHWFDKAACAFETAYGISGSLQEKKAYLSALRMGMREEEYVKKIAEMPEYGELSLELEKQFAQAKSQWPASQTGESFQRDTALRRAGQNREYYERIEEIVSGLKESYRSSME